MTSHGGWRATRIPLRSLAASALLVTVAACSSSSSSAPTTIVPLRTTTSAAATTAANTTTTARAATTTRPATTTTRPTATSTTSAATTSSTTSTLAASTTSSSTTTTVNPAAAKLVLGDQGLGGAVFGADPDQVIAYVTAALGKPTTDSGWADAATNFEGCPGTEDRSITWGDLTLMFSDQSWVATGRRHFFSYAYGPPFGNQITPAGLATKEHIGIGSTVKAVRAAYPTAVVNPGDQQVAANFILSDHFSGFLTGDQDTDTVTAINGGVGCGE